MDNFTVVMRSSSSPKLYRHNSIANFTNFVADKMIICAKAGKQLQRRNSESNVLKKMTDNLEMVTSKDGKDSVGKIRSFTKYHLLE